MSRIRKYTDEHLKAAVAETFCMADTLRKLGLIPAGGNYSVAKTKIKHLGLSTTHWSGRSANRRGAVLKHSKLSLEEILVEHSTYSRGLLKRRLLKAGVLLPICVGCQGLDVWQGKPLVLHLDHINGIHDDNRLTNLRLLCPNCHSQTDTYTGRNKPKATPKRCIDCDVKIHKSSTRCVACSNTR